MIFAIDTSELKKIKIRYDFGGKVVRREFSFYADEALAKIAPLLKKFRPQALGVVVGPGAWSATRSGVALMNALSYATSLPLVSLAAEQFDSPLPLKKGEKKSVRVVYAGLPNITRKKYV
jgi:tRNA A37 threonylcarbamoyladenosine modification protein TsaB